jgi:hypothetical protein
LYNHACLNGDIETFRAMMRAAGITGGYDEFNQWCVRQRRGLPVSEVLAEWREANGETRHRMTQLGRDAPLTTAAGPYPAGLQAFHYSSEYATHADDVAAPVAPGEWPGRTAWRVSFGRFALTEQDAPVKTWTTNNEIWYKDHYLRGPISSPVPRAGASTARARAFSPSPRFVRRWLVKSPRTAGGTSCPQH